MNKIVFGDNLEVMRNMKDKSIDLIATDPPFNSGRDYNIFLKDSLAQNKAFTDIWQWDDKAKETREEIEELATCPPPSKYQDLNRALIGYDYLLDHAVKGPKAKIRSYLAFMGPRIVEMHRLLKDTGSFYLHCDPSASHYLKALCDVIFNENNFRNEIIWRKYAGRKNNAKYKFSTQTDTILFYVKSKDAVFNPLFVPISDKEIERNYRYTDDDGRRYRLSWGRHYQTTGEQRRIYLDEQPGAAIGSLWVEDGLQLNTSTKERLGYPTQKPKELYERIIKASSKEGDIVLDPFCGCGTTLDAAQNLNRKWIGIDITNLALTPMEQRLSRNYNLVKGKDYQIFGYPTNMQEVERFIKVEKKYHEVANWAINELGLMPTKNIGDGGIDGIGYGFIWTPEGMRQESCKIVAEVKTGNISITQIRAFCHSMTEFQAKIGILVTFSKPTKAMWEYQEKQGKYEHNGKTYYHLQIWHIDERYFEDKESKNQQIKIPGIIRKTDKI